MAWSVGEENSVAQINPLFLKIRIHPSMPWTDGQASRTKKKYSVQNLIQKCWYCGIAPLEIATYSSNSTVGIVVATIPTQFSAGSDTLIVNPGRRSWLGVGESHGSEWPRIIQLPVPV